MGMPLNRQGGRVRAPWGGRARENRKFIQAPSPEIWSETISGGEEVLAQKWGGLFWATSLEKIFGGGLAIILFRPGGWMQQSAVPRCAILSVESTGGISGEAARLRHARWRRGGRVAARGPRAAGDAGGRISWCGFARAVRAADGGIPPRLGGSQLRRGAQRRDRIPLGRRAIRSTAGASGRVCAPSGGGDRRVPYPCRSRGKGCNDGHPDCVQRRGGSG